MSAGAAEMEALDPEINDPTTLELHKEVRSLGLIPVVDAASYQVAGERWKALTRMEKKVGEHFDPPVEAAHGAWKSAVALRRKFLDPLAANKAEQVKLMKAWEAAEELKRINAERKAQEEAQRKAEEDALEAAAQLERDGFKEAAREVLDTPVEMPMVVAPRVVPKGYGAATRKTWKVAVMDMRALVKAVMDGTVPMIALMPNDVFLGQQARSLKNEMKYPGVRVWED
jgi:hypothetical protein